MSLSMGVWDLLERTRWPHWAGKMLAKRKETGNLRSGKNFPPFDSLFWKTNKKHLEETHSCLQRGLGEQEPFLWTTGLSNLGSSPRIGGYTKSPGRKQSGMVLLLVPDLLPGCLSTTHALLPSETFSFSPFFFSSLLPEVCSLHSPLPNQELNSLGWKGWWALKCDSSGITDVWACTRHTHDFIPSEDIVSHTSVFSKVSGHRSEQRVQTPTLSGLISYPGVHMT